MKKIIVFTDLDGTLLQHHDYDWKAAQSAISLLESNQFPLIYNSSKTYAEIKAFSKITNNKHPFICENGSAIAIPKGYFNQDDTDVCDYQIIFFGKEYKEIISILNNIRHSHSFKFEGFNDMGVDGIVKATNLSAEQAEAASQRVATEPIQWNDSPTALTEFKQLLKSQGLILQRGGRFYHVMSPVDKADAIRWLVEKYKQYEPDTEWLTVGLGDSQNDVKMLELVNIPVLISNPDSQPPIFNNRLENLMQPKSPGPAGWNQAVQSIIQTMI